MREQQRAPPEAVRAQDRAGEEGWDAFVGCVRGGQRGWGRKRGSNDCNPKDRDPLPPAKPADKKKCTKCLETKPLTDFGVRTDNKYGVPFPRSHCKPCRRKGNPENPKKKRKLEKENLDRGPLATKQKRG